MSLGSTRLSPWRPRVVITTRMHRRCYCGEARARERALLIYLYRCTYVRIHTYIGVSRCRKSGGQSSGSGKYDVASPDGHFNSARGSCSALQLGRKIKFILRRLRLRLKLQLKLFSCPEVLDRDRPFLAVTAMLRFSFHLRSGREGRLWVGGDHVSWTAGTIAAAGGR